MVGKQNKNWEFIDHQGTFELKNPLGTSYLYFTLVNQAGMMSSITPDLKGDAKLNQNAYLLLPVSVEDLYTTRSGRNFWVRINGEPWSVTGCSARQIDHTTWSQDEDVRLRAGFLWHAVDRTHENTGLTASVTSFVPANEDYVELMCVRLANQGTEALTLDPIAAVPIYGRSADNLRDHRHVTSLLHRTYCSTYGVFVKPTMSFDERGHMDNTVTYAVLGADGEGAPPAGFTPLVEDFIGEGGNLDWPQAVVEDHPLVEEAGSVLAGFESIGALHFAQVRLKPGESKTYVLVLGILTEEADLETLIKKYGTEKKFNDHLEKNQAYWQDKLSALQFDHQQGRRDGWLQWVTLQPTLRRIMGNSFLPYHDYGRGGRGWRDLWQDLLALLLTQGAEIDQTLLSNFAGIRMDGSNATIVGTAPGEFKADRNSIPRVWMDHGAWPLITTKLYMDQTGDIHFLLRDQSYFRDHLHHRCQKTDQRWEPGQGTRLTSVSGDVVEGSVLEHLLVQHLTAFFNVGEHNLIRLEGGDWNDGLDMAAERGESVAFSAMYAGNLGILSGLCLELKKAGVESISLAEELIPLLDQIAGPVDYDQVGDKQALLQTYFDSVQGDLSGKKISVDLDELCADLKKKADWLADHIRKQEWIADQDGRGCFNGYYDNLGQRVEGDHPLGFRMTLTGQVFPLMAGIATEEQAGKIVRAADHFLYDEALHGYCLNTNFVSDFPKLGRAFGFAYGHKENGAAFSHMSVMFAYALYRQGLAEEAWRILDGLFDQNQDFPASRIYPGIPEYFNPRGRGMYPYLTGSAAWYLFTVLTESFGVKGQMGDLRLEPKLTPEQFSKSDHVRVRTLFAGKMIEVMYHNPKRLPYGDYCIGSVTVNGSVRTTPARARFVTILRNEVLAWPEETRVEVNLR